MNARIRDLVEATPFVDTHEHLLEEGTRLAGKPTSFYQATDWSLLFRHYLGDDLASAGMPNADLNRFFAPETGVDEKYRLLAPWWQRTLHTGYAQAVRWAIEDLYGIRSLDERSVHLLAERFQASVKPGFYQEILSKRSLLETCQVNSLERIFMSSGLPDLLRQDLSFLALANPDLGTVERESGKTAKSLDEWLGIIDWYFSTYGPKAVATKNQCAYSRRLNFAKVERGEAEPLFARHAKGENLQFSELETLQNFLFRYCVKKSTEQGLPVKLHTGYYAGRNGMPLERVKHNLSDLCPLLKDFPETKFVLMHIAYPYQDEAISIAKHYTNAYVDLCWAWIINPASSVRLVKEFVLAAPANKLFTFGGDYLFPECVYGHAKIARQGLAQAISELVEEKWVRQEEAPHLVERLMRGNARELFPDRKPA